MESVARCTPQPLPSARVYWLDTPQPDPVLDLEIPWQMTRTKHMTHSLMQPSPHLPLGLQPPPPPPPLPLPPPPLLPPLSPLPFPARPLCVRCGRMRVTPNAVSEESIARVAEGTAAAGEPLFESSGAPNMRDASRSVLPALVSDPDAFGSETQPAWPRVTQQRSLEAFPAAAAPRPRLSPPSVLPPLALQPSALPPSALSPSALPPLAVPPSGLPAPEQSAVSGLTQNCELRSNCSCLTRGVQGYRAMPSWALRNYRNGLLRNPIVRPARSRNLSSTFDQAPRELDDLVSEKQLPKSAGSAERPEMLPGLSVERGGDGLYALRPTPRPSPPAADPPGPQHAPAAAEHCGESKSNETDAAVSDAAGCKGNGSGDGKQVLLEDELSINLQNTEIKNSEHSLSLDKNKKCEIEEKSDYQISNVSSEKSEEISEEALTVKENVSVGINCIKKLLESEEKDLANDGSMEKLEAGSEGWERVREGETAGAEVAPSAAPAGDKPPLPPRGTASGSDCSHSHSNTSDSASKSCCSSSDLSSSPSSCTSASASCCSTSASTSCCSSSSPSWVERGDDAACTPFWGYWSDDGVPRGAPDGHTIDCDPNEGSTQGSSGMQGDSTSDDGPCKSSTAIADLPPDPSATPSPAGDWPSAKDPSSPPSTPTAPPSGPASPPCPLSTPDTPGNPTEGASSADDEASPKQWVLTLEQLVTNKVDGLTADLSMLSFSSSGCTVPPTPTPSLASIDPSDPAAAALALAAIRNPCVSMLRRRPSLHISIPGVSPRSADPSPQALPVAAADSHCGGSGTRRSAGRGRGGPASGYAVRGDRGAWGRRRGGCAPGSSGRGAGAGVGGALARGRALGARPPGAIAGCRVGAAPGTCGASSVTGGGASCGRKGSGQRPTLWRSTWSPKVRAEEAAATAAALMYELKKSDVGNTGKRK